MGLKKQELINVLTKAHDAMDELNADRGTKWEYCLFCQSTYYGSITGITHRPECIITTVRDALGIS